MSYGGVEEPSSSRSRGTSTARRSATSAILTVILSRSDRASRNSRMVNARPGWDADKTLGTYELGPNISAGLPTPQPVSLLNAALLNGVHGSIYAIQPQKSTPCADDWSVSLEYRLRPMLALEARVTSSMGVHLYATYDSNQPSPSPNESVV